MVEEREGGVAEKLGIVSFVGFRRWPVGWLAGLRMVIFKC